MKSTFESYGTTSIQDSSAIKLHIEYMVQSNSMQNIYWICYIIIFTLYSVFVYDNTTRFCIYNPLNSNDV